MTAQVARLALPFTDGDLATGDVRVYNTATATAFTVTLPLPSVSGVSGGYYNGGDLDGGDTTTFTLPDESIVMALAMAISVHVSGFDIDVTEDVLPGRYTMERQDANQWELRWDDALTTMPGAWLGFDDATYVSSSQIITAPWQSDRLWRATRPTWNRQREHKKTSHAMTWSGGVSTRQLSNIRNEWELKYSAQVGPRVYKHDGTIQTLVDLVPEMALGDPNVALESLWEWIAARTPVEYWADEDDLTTSVYLRPLRAEMLEAAIRVIGGERSSAPPVYDLVLPFVNSTAGAAGVGGGGIVCPSTGVLITYATYNDLPTNINALGAPADGTHALVTTTQAAGVYAYVASVDGYTLDMWLPAEYVARGITYVVEAGGDPMRVSPHIGGETLATLTGRSWTDGSNLAATITDVSTYLRFQTNSVGGGSTTAALDFSPVHNGVKTLWVVEMAPILASSPSGLSAAVRWRDGVRSVDFTRASAAVNDDTEFSVGDGLLTTTGFDRFFVTGSNLAGSLDSSAYEVWSANLGRSYVAGAGAQRSQFPSTGATNIRLYCSDSASGSIAEMHVQEFHAFEVG